MYRLATAKCDICGDRTARYVCQVCGRGVCELCFEPVSWSCVSCAGQPTKPTEGPMWLRMDWFSKLFLVGFAIIFVGILLMMIGTLLSGVGAVSGGGFILIGPIPIGFGFGPHSFLILVLALVLTIVSVLLYWMATRRR
ncbi:MAG: DUF131 domain-containing protein [Candidatus Bathyarchaeia archaeon]